MCSVNVLQNFVLTLYVRLHSHSLLLCTDRLCSVCASAQLQPTALYWPAVLCMCVYTATAYCSVLTGCTLYVRLHSHSLLLCTDRLYSVCASAQPQPTALYWPAALCMCVSTATAYCSVLTGCPNWTQFSRARMKSGSESFNTWRRENFIICSLCPYMSKDSTSANIN